MRLRGAVVCLCGKCIKEDGAPERIRTSDPQIRSLMLYPAELRARANACGAWSPSGAGPGRKRDVCLIALHRQCKGFMAVSATTPHPTAKRPKTRGKTAL